MKNFSENEFLDKLNLAPWGSIYAAENLKILEENPEDATPQEIINKQVTILENTFRNVVDEVAPFKTFRVTRPPTPWLTDEMKIKMNERDKLRALYKKDFDPEIHEKYKELRNEINHEKRKAKIKHFNKNINTQTRNSKKIHKALKIEGVVDSKNNDSDFSVKTDLNLLNNAFTANNNKAIDPNKLEQNILNILRNALPPTFRFQKVSELVVIKIIKSLKLLLWGLIILVPCL